jgi:hypothetical protein
MSISKISASFGNEKAAGPKDPPAAFVLTNLPAGA